MRGLLRMLPRRNVKFTNKRSTSLMPNKNIIFFIVMFGIFIAIYFSDPPESVNTILVGEPEKQTLEIKRAALSAKQVITQQKSQPSKTQVNVLLQEEIELEQEQTTLALELINSTDNEERTEGIEILSAYPKPEFEIILAQLLANDDEPDIRNVAALGLASFDVLSDASISDLMTALNDKSEDVRLNSWSTLDNYLMGLEEESHSRKMILSQLTTKLTNKEIPEDISETIKESLESE